MFILYGTFEKCIDVTETCLTKLKKNNKIIIPSNDGIRAQILSDPLVGVLKKIYIFINNSFMAYDCLNEIHIDLDTYQINTINYYDIKDKVTTMHSKLHLKYGSFSDEFPEQMMVTRYLTGNEKVLEIGGNIGRNSLIIGSILGNNQNQLVVMECDEDISKQLEENRELNHFNFKIENSALSKRRLIQKGWDTMESNILLDEYKWVKTITLDELKLKYQIDFDTLVLDCEGAFYYILMDMPEILQNIQTIIIENDYHNIVHKIYVDNVLKENNFYVEYQEAGGWGPCFNMFFQVWKKNI